MMLVKKERIKIYQDWVRQVKESEGFKKMKWLKDMKGRPYPALLKYNYHHGFLVIDFMPPWEN